MAEEEKKEEQQQPQVDESAELKAQLKALQDKISQYEQMLLDPAYLEFLAIRDVDTKGKSLATKETQQQEVDLDSMSNKDLVEYILSSVRGMLNQTIVPLKQEAQVTAAMQQVKEAAAKYPDFWDYRDEMIRLARAHPTLTAEEAYHLAKSRANRAPRKPSKPAEAPTGGAQMKRKPPEGFEAKFLEAWRAAGFEQKE
jgi:hypothetical protein